MPDVPTVANVFEAILEPFKSMAQQWALTEKTHMRLPLRETHQFGEQYRSSQGCWEHLYFGTNCEMGFLHSC